MKLMSYEVHNVLGVKDVEFHMDGHHLFLVGGKNGQGKSSALNALVCCLAGKRKMPNYPEVLLPEDQNEGWVKAQLSGHAEWMDEKGFEAELFIRRKRGGAIVEEFTIRDSTGAPSPTPRRLMHDVMGEHSIGMDPFAILHVDKKQARATVSDLLGLDMTKDQRERKDVYDERTGVNRQVKQMQARYDALPFHADVEGESEIAIGEVMEQRKAAESGNKAADEAVRLADAADEAVESNNKLVEEIAAEIEDLKLKLKLAEDREAELVETGVKAAKGAKQLRAKADKAVKSKVDLDVFDAKISEAADHNKKVEANLHRDEFRRELEEQQAESERLTAKIEDIDKRMQRAMESVEWPVEGMAIDDEGLLLNGLPLEQCSTAEQYRVAIRIAMALNPDLKLFVSRHGNDLDEAALEALDEVLKEKDYQLLLELVTRTDDDEDLCHVVMRNGMAVSAKGEDTAEAT